VVGVSERLDIYQLADAPHGVGAGKFTAEPAPPEGALFCTLFKWYSEIFSIRSRTS
jgi:hypothetical protein